MSLGARRNRCGPCWGVAEGALGLAAARRELSWRRWGLAGAALEVAGSVQGRSGRRWGVAGDALGVAGFRRSCSGRPWGIAGNALGVPGPSQRLLWASLEAPRRRSGCRWGLGSVWLQCSALSNFNACAGFQCFASIQCSILVSMLSFTSRVFWLGIRFGLLNRCARSRSVCIHLDWIVSVMSDGSVSQVDGIPGCGVLTS